MAERLFPMQVGPSFPWRMIAPHDGQAQTNHDQSLETLARRGGCDPGEVWCIVEGRPLRDHQSKTAAQHLEWITEWIKADEVGGLLATVDALTAELAKAMYVVRHWHDDGETLDEAHAHCVAMQAAEDRRLADPEAKTADDAAAERFRTLLADRENFVGERNDYSWQQKCEVAEATNVRLTAERDALAAQVAALKDEKGGD